MKRPEPKTKNPLQKEPKSKMFCFVHFVMKLSSECSGFGKRQSLFIRVRVHPPAKLIFAIKRNRLKERKNDVAAASIAHRSLHLVIGVKSNDIVRLNALCSTTASAASIISFGRRFSWRYRSLLHAAPSIKPLDILPGIQPGI